MASLTMADKEIELKYGKRPTNGIAFDQPQELGYICPQGHSGDYLTWSEFNEHIWCYICENDYHYANDCQLKRMCWMTDKVWNNLVDSLPQKPKILDGIQHFFDCYIEVKPYKRAKVGLRNKTQFIKGYYRLKEHKTTKVNG